MMSPLGIALAMIAFIFSFASSAFAETPASVQSQNGQINGFRYQSCEGTKCVVVEAPRAWLSVANGAFVAESALASNLAAGSTGAAAEHAMFRLLTNRKVIREFKASEIVLRPEIGMMTIETSNEVVLFDLATYELEAVRK
ncbi:MAG: hypothetical protein U1E10_12535 [Bdellovibrionales bacterium]|nr:hypothetical protein [Bdellovibrionales bacterium]